ncbi:MAG: TRAP transporter substrate-binding protein [Hyphomicrobiaceae bacterium]|nr:TRAP transporter substrate-binding protein [Hyphomicrobiaceae bacterium]
MIALVRALRAMVFGLTMTMFGGNLAMAETWSLAHLQPADSVEGQVHQRFADLVKAYTSGELEINVFPSSQLGSTPELWQQVEGGVIQIFAEGTGGGNQYVSEMQWISAPFMFDSVNHWKRFLQSGVMKPYFDRLEAEHNVTVLGEVIGDQSLMPRPYRTIVTKQPFRGVPDLKGLKLRMFESKFHIDVWNYLGATPIVLGWADVYEALRNGVVSGVTSPLSLVESTKFYEQAPNVARTDEYPNALAYFTNSQAWNSLRQETRDAVIRAYKETANYYNELAGNQVDDTLAFFRANNVNFVELETKDFTDRMKSFYQKMVDDGDLPRSIWEAVQATR